MSQLKQGEFLWIGEAVRAGPVVMVARLTIPADFAAKVNQILTSGATLFVTNQALYPQTTGSTLQVVDADPPPKT